MVLLFLLRRYADETAVHHQEGRAWFLCVVEQRKGGGWGCTVELTGLNIKYLCQNDQHPGLIKSNVLQCNDKLEKGLI